MAQGDANKVWLVPSDFGKALKGFTKMLGAPGDDGVFRFEPSPGRGGPARAPRTTPTEVADWFNTKTDPAIAKAVAEAEAVARKPVDPAVPASAPQALPPSRPARGGFMPTGEPEQAADPQQQNPPQQ